MMMVGRAVTLSPTNQFYVLINHCYTILTIPMNNTGMVTNGNNTDGVNIYLCVVWLALVVTAVININSFSEWIFRTPVLNQVNRCAQVCVLSNSEDATPVFSLFLPPVFWPLIFPPKFVSPFFLKRARDSAPFPAWPRLRSCAGKSRDDSSLRFRAKKRNSF